MLTSAASMASITSITSMLVVGLTTGSAILSVILVLTFVSKEVSLSVPNTDHRLLDSLNAALIPLVFAFGLIFLMETLKVIS